MFEYIRDMYDKNVDTFFDSSFVVVGTINIQGTDITNTSMYDMGIGDPSGMYNDPVLVDMPQDMLPTYRIKFFPLEKTGLMLRDGTKITYGIAGQFEPFDLWIACKKEDVTAFGKTLIDHAQSIEIRGSTYRVKGQIPDYFGTQQIIYVFLERQ